MCVCVCVSFPSGFEVQMKDLIVLVLDCCLSFYFFDCLGYWDKAPWLRIFGFQYDN